MTRFWVVLLHCVLVVVSMYAVGIRRFGKAPVLIPLGFLSFVVFAFTEWLRTTLAIFALNRTWRNTYATAGADAARSFAENFINAFGGFNDAFFFIFFTCFLAGCACYGFAYKTGDGWDRKIGWLFLLWTLTGLPAWIDEIVQTSFASYLSWTWYYQCVARAILAVWLWKTAENLNAMTLSATNKISIPS